jgi:hypothetical protein
VTPHLSRNAQLVKFFAQQYRGVPRTRLVKLIYMADLLAREYLGEPISTLDYYKYKHGPYDEAIESAVGELVASKLADDIRDPWGRGLYKRVVDLRQSIPFDFSLGESAVLDYVVTNYRDMDMKELLVDVVYETKPFKAVSRYKQKLPMGIVNNAGTAAVGFKLEEILRAEQAGRSGDFVTLSEFVDELRAKAPA